MTQVVEVSDGDQFELEPMPGGRVSLLVKSEAGGRVVCLHLSPEAVMGLLADVEEAADRAEHVDVDDDGSDAAYDRLQDASAGAGL